MTNGWAPPERPAPGDPNVPGQAPQGLPPYGSAPQGWPQQAHHPHAGAPQPQGAPFSAPVPPGPPGSAATENAAKAAQLADGEWHRLHGATPLLRGGLAFIVILGVVFANTRDWIINLFIPDEYDYNTGDPLVAIFESGAAAWVVLGIVVLLILSIAGFWLAWRFAQFRIGDTEVEIKTGIISRKHRRAPLNRIQAIQVTKPWFARLFGACKLDIETAGAEGKVELAYLSIAVADDLRREILHRASGRQERLQQAQSSSHQLHLGHVPIGSTQMLGNGMGNSRVDATVREFLDPDAEIASLPPDQVVRMHTGRAIVSSLLDGTLAWILIIFGAITIPSIVLGFWPMVFFVLPALFGWGAFAIRELLLKLRFVVAATPDGIRLAYGVATTTTENVPPGRIHALQLTQPLLWRPFGWWQLKMTRAVVSSADSSGQQKQLNNKLLPVGTLDEVRRIVRAIAPELIDRYPGAFEAGLVGTGEQPDGFTTSPKRAAWFHWISWRRNGVLPLPVAFLLRTGRWNRTLSIIPAARVQSIAMTQGIVPAWCSLASIRFHLVGMFTSNAVTSLDAGDTMRLWNEASARVLDAMGRDGAESWGRRPVAPSSPQLPAHQPVMHGSGFAPQFGPGFAPQPAPQVPSSSPGPVAGSAQQYGAPYSGAPASPPMQHWSPPSASLPGPPMQPQLQPPFQPPRPEVPPGTPLPPQPPLPPTQPFPPSAPPQPDLPPLPPQDGRQ